MSTDIVLYASGIVVLLIISAFFSGSKSAYFTLTPLHMESYRMLKLSAGLRIKKLMQSPQQMLITIELCKLLANVSIAVLSVLLVTTYLQNLGLSTVYVVVLDIAVVTLILAILTDLMPRVIAVRNAEAFALHTSLIMIVIYYLIFPISFLLYKYTGFLQKHSGFPEEKMLLTEEELKVLAETSDEEGMLQKDEKEMIHSIFEFGETTVREIMIPRTDMVIIDTDTTLSQLMELFKTKLHSRIPVYRSKLENIIGILYVKDLLPYLSKRKREKIEFESLVRPAYFVPEQKKIDELLREFQTEHIHLSLVVDEYGGISGLVTLEDIIEEIVGEIQDEYDKELPLFRKLNNSTYIVDGRMSVEELNKDLGFNLPVIEGVETISGFVLNLLGSMPKEKEEVNFDNYYFRVEKINRNRILNVRIEKRPVEEDEGTED